LVKGADYSADVIPFSEAWYSTGSSPDPSWWDPNYDYRKKITVSAGSKAIPSGYPVKFSFDHKSLVDAVPSKSLANGDDIRIAYYNGASWAEVDRVLFNDNINSSSWNDPSGTIIMFKTQAQIAASGSDEGYYLYYDYPSATNPPTDTPSSRFYLAESLGATETSSTTYATKVQLQFTPSSTDEHWVVVATWRQRHLTGLGVQRKLGHGRISLNGSPRTGTVDTQYESSGDLWKTFQAFLKITGTASQQTVSIDHRSDGGTDGIDNARIVAFLIPDPTNADIQYDEALAKTADTVNPTDALTTTFTPSSQGDYIWMANGFCHEGPGGAVPNPGGLFAVDETGADQQNTKESYMSASDGFVPFIHFERRQNLTASSKTFTIRHRPDASNASERQGLTQLLFRTDVFDAVEAASSTGDTYATTSYDDEPPNPKNTLTTASVGSAQDFVYLAVMGFRLITRDITLSSFGEIRLGGAQQLEDEVAIDRDNYQRQIAWAWAENTTGNRTIDSRIKEESGHDTLAQYAHTIALRYIEPGTAEGTEEDQSSTTYTQLSTTYTQLAAGGLSAGSNEYMARSDNNYTLDFAAAEDYLYLGSTSKFRGINVDLVAPVTGSSLNLAWEYWNGTGWTDLETTSGFTDDTNHLTQDGTIYWSADPANWSQTSVNSGTDLYYVRTSLAGGSYDTSPVENLIKTDFLLLQHLGTITGTTLGLTGPTAIELVDFRATGSGDTVRVSWETAHETNNLGFNIHRSTSKDGSYTKLNASLIPGLLSSATGRKYTFDDPSVSKGQLYYYKLEDIDSSGHHRIHGPVCVDWDADGMPDDWERDHGLDPTMNDGNFDYDNDGLTNYEEYERGTDPFNPDTDGDGIPDGQEGGKLPSTPGEGTKGDGIKVISQDEKGMVLELKTSGFDSIEIHEGGTTYQRLTIPSYTHGLTETVGSPELPVKGYWVDLPEGMDITLEVETVETQSSSGYLVYPVPEKIALEEQVIEEFTLDTQAYGVDSFMPDERVQKGTIAHLRDQKKGQVLFSPISFNPHSGELGLHPGKDYLYSRSRARDAGLWVWDRPLRAGSGRSQLAPRVESALQDHHNRGGHLPNHCHRAGHRRHRLARPPPP
jgi:hypothetical protein